MKKSSKHGKFYICTKCTKTFHRFPQNRFPSLPLSPPLRDPKPDPLEEIPRHGGHILFLQGIRLLLARQNVNLVDLVAPRRAEPDFVSEVEGEEDGNGDVGGEEGGGGEFAGEEDAEAVGEGEEDEEDEGEVGGVGLEAGLVGPEGEGVVVDEGFAEALTRNKGLVVWERKLGGGREMLTM